MSYTKSLHRSQSPLPVLSRSIHIVQDTPAVAPAIKAFHVDPATQLVHTPSLEVVAGVSPLPDVHDVMLRGRHAPVLSNALNVPVLHAVHVESVDAVPAANPKPAGHLVSVCGMQAPPPAENVFPVHAPAQIASALGVPAISGAPAEQVGVECVLHAVWSLPEL